MADAGLSIELLWWEGCPSTDRVERQVRDTLAALGHEAVAIERREINDHEEAHAARFVGSPTVRVAGKDLFPPPPDEPFGLACRVYRLRDGRLSPTPDPSDLRDALAGLVADTDPRS